MANPAVPITLPAIMGFVEPSLEIIKPEVGPKISKTRANGSCTFAVVTGSSPKPSGVGLRIKTGIVWNTMNIDIPTIIIMIFDGRMVLLSNILRSISGDFDLFSIITNNTRYTIPMTINPNIVDEPTESPVSTNVSAIKNEVTEIASVTMP